MIRGTANLQTSREAERMTPTMSSNAPIVAVTRPAHSAAELKSAIEALGARVVLHPTSVIGPAPDLAAFAAARRGIASFHYVVVTSVNGVDTLLADPIDRGGLSRVRFAAVGKKTAEALKARGFSAAVVATDGRTLASELERQVRGVRVLVARGDRADAVLPVALREAGATVDEVVVYSNVAAPLTAIEAFEKSLLAGEIDAVTFAAGSAVTAIVEQIGPERAKACLRRTSIAAMGRTVEVALAALGLQAAAVAERNSNNALAAAAISAVNTHRLRK